MLARAHYQGFAAPISGYGNQPVSRSQVYRATEGGSTNYHSQITPNPIVVRFQMCIDRRILLSTTYKLIQLRHYQKDSLYDSMIG